MSRVTGLRRALGLFEIEEKSPKKVAKKTATKVQRTPRSKAPETRVKTSKPAQRKNAPKAIAPVVEAAKVKKPAVKSIDTPKKQSKVAVSPHADQDDQYFVPYD